RVQRVEVQRQVVALTLDLRRGDCLARGVVGQGDRACAAVDLGGLQVGRSGRALLDVADRTGRGLDGLHDTGRLLRALASATLELLARALGPRLRRGGGQVLLEV